MISPLNKIQVSTHKPHNMEDIPTMPKLQLLKLPANQDGEDLRIVEDIGTHYLDFGTKLLNDKQGSRVKALEHQFQRDCNAINWKILQAWISGEGREPISWKTLVTVLKEIQLGVLARKIETSLAHHAGSLSSQRKALSKESTNPGSSLPGTVTEAVIPPTTKEAVIPPSIKETVIPPTTTSWNEQTVLVRPHSTTGSFITQNSSSIFFFTSLAIAFIVLLIAMLVALLLRQ